MKKLFELNVIENNEIRFKFRLEVNQYKNVLVKERVATHRNNYCFIKIEVDCNETFTKSDVSIRTTQTSVEAELFASDFTTSNVDNIDDVNESVNVNNLSLAKILNATRFTRIRLIFLRISATKLSNV